MMRHKRVWLLGSTVPVAIVTVLLLLPAAALGGPTRVTGTLSQDTSWTADAGPYIVDNILTVPASKVLSIGPGTVVKLSPRATIIVEGELNASGASGLPVVFTSLRDDATAGDTGGDGPTTAQPGEWNDIYFAPRSRGVLSHCTVKYGGSSAQLPGTSHFASANLTSENSSVVLKDCVLSDSATNGFHAVYAASEVSGCVFERNGRHGLALEHSSASVTSCSFRDNSEYGIWADDDSMGAPGAGVAGCSFSGNRAGMSVAPSAVGLAPGNEFLLNREGAVHVRDGTLSSPAVWRKLQYPYVVESTVVVDGRASLSAEAGTVIKFAGNGGIVVYGMLQLQGSASEPIALTSLKDDEVGGDTNSDANTSLPGPANWNGVVFALGSSGRISNCRIRYGASSRQLAPGLFAIGAVSCYTDAVTLQSSELHGNTIGVYCSGASATVTSCSILDSKEAGVRCDKGSMPKITDCEIGGRYINPNKGIMADASSLTQVGAEPLIARNTLRNNRWAFAVSPSAMANVSGTNAVSACANGAVMLAPGQVSGSVLWPAFGGAYLLTGSVTVPSGASLSIAPGVVVKAQQDTEIAVSGTLWAEGRPDARIVFTSAKDDASAGDTNGDR
ncbi:MAG: right-handed parallel beta-helix repeat-containing protein, partial [Armatimonadota bacterium]